MSINYIYKWTQIFFYVWEVNNYRASKMEMTAFHAHNRGKKQVKNNQARPQGK